jgi:hypothetical protein
MSRGLRTVSLAALLAAFGGGTAGATPGSVPELEGLRVMVPDAVGSAGDGRAALIGRLRRDLRDAIGATIPEREIDAAQRSLKLSGTARYTLENLAAAARKLKAPLVLFVEVKRRGWLYTAHARLIDVESLETKMDFRAGYYQPQLDAADRGARIARTTVDKLSSMLGAGELKIARPSPPPAADTSAPPGGDGTGAAASTETTETPDGTGDGSAVAIESSGDARDADIFGSADEGTGDARDADIFGGGDDTPREGQRLLVPGSAIDIDDRLDEADSRLAIGGQLFLRMRYSLLDEGNALQDFPVTSPNLFDLFVDARPNRRLRAYAQARLAVNFAATATSAANPNPPAQSRVILDQLWLNFDLGRTVFATIGRKRIKYGTGRFWNPTDFLNPARIDGLATFDERTGVDLAQFHLPIESLGWNFYLIGSLSDTDSLEALALTARAEVLLGVTEIAITAHSHVDRPFRLGFDLSTGFGPLDLHTEAALVRGGSGRFWTGSFDPGAGVFPTADAREDDYFLQLVGGLELQLAYSEFDDVIIGIEYFYNQAGYEDSKLLNWVLLSGDFQPFYHGQHYAGMYVSFPNPGDLADTTFSFSGITNLSDLSFVSRLDFQIKLLTYLDFEAFASINYGRIGEFRLRVEVPAAPGVPGLDAGLEIPAVTAQFGTGFSVKF